MSNKPAQNTDRELWRKTDDYYSPSLHVTEGGGIGINVGGTVFVKPIEEWHALASRPSTPVAAQGQDFMHKQTIAGIAERLESMYEFAQDSLRLDADHVLRIEELGYMLKGEISRLAGVAASESTSKEKS